MMRSGWIVLGILLGVTQVGCIMGGLGMAAVTEVRGANAELRPGHQVAPDALSRFRSVTFLPATASMGPRVVPVNMPAQWREQSAEVERELARDFPGGEPRLTVSVELLYFQEKSFFSEAELLARVQMVSDTEVVFDGVVKAESKSLRQHGEASMVRAALKEIAKYLRAQRPRSDQNDRGEAA